MSYAVRLVSELYPHVSPRDIRHRLWYCTFVNFERRYLYYEVPKAACTSMKTLIHSLEDLPRITTFAGSLTEVRREMFIHSRDQFALKSLVDFEDDLQEQILSSPDFLRFTIVRNPYTRLVSAWKDKIRVCAPGYTRFYNRIKGALPQGSDPTSFISFAEFVRAISEEDLRSCDHHWRLQVEHTFYNAMKFNLVGRVESLQDAVGVFLDKAGFPGNRLPGAVNESSGTTGYEQELAEHVYDLYIRDFADLGYAKGSWQSTGETVDRRSGLVPEIRFLDEITERNIVIDHLYSEREVLFKSVGQWTQMEHLPRLEIYRTCGFDELFAQYISKINGWLSKEEAAYLYGLAKSAEVGTIVEIGSYRGRSTAALAFGAIAGGGLAVYAVDPHEIFIGPFGGRFGPVDRGFFMKSMVELGLYHQVRLLNLSSELMGDYWPSPVALLWIDGDHRYSAVKRDFEHWQGKLAESAMVVFDDASDRSGPGQFARELLQGGNFVLDAVVGKIMGLRRNAACAGL